jgi:hypothetical protein
VAVVIDELAEPVPVVLRHARRTEMKGAELTDRQLRRPPVSATSMEMLPGVMRSFSSISSRPITWAADANMTAAAAAARSRYRFVDRGRGVDVNRPPGIRIDPGQSRISPENGRWINTPYVGQAIPVVAEQAHRLYSCTPRSRSELATTLTLESAIAPAASAGDSNQPKTG